MDERLREVEPAPHPAGVGADAAVGSVEQVDPPQHLVGAAASLGGGEAVPTIANLPFLGKLLGVPYVPLTPYLIPLPGGGLLIDTPGVREIGLWQAQAGIEARSPSQKNGPIGNR